MHFFKIGILIFERSKGTERKKKKKIYRPRIEPVSRQNKFESGPFSALSTCANEAVVSDYCIIVTSLFSKTIGFFCFSFNKKSLEDALGKMCFFAYVISQKGSKLQGKTRRTLFKTPKQNCMQNLERFWQSSILRKIPNAFFHRTLHEVTWD